VGFAIAFTGIAFPACRNNIGSGMRATLRKRNDVVLRQMTFPAFMTIVAAMILRSLNLDPLRTRQVIKRRIGFCRPPPLFLLGMHFRICFRPFSFIAMDFRRMCCLVCSYSRDNCWLMVKVVGMRLFFVLGTVKSLFLSKLFSMRIAVDTVDESMPFCMSNLIGSHSKCFAGTAL
jgi:hypothetical protein